ncbi:MAG: hypothetical protein AAGA00_00845 [Pseudomonadota bacterium]
MCFLAVNSAIYAHQTAHDRQFIYLPTERAVSLAPMLVEMIVWGIRTGDKDAGSDFLDRFETERDKLIRALQQKVRDDAGPL